MTDTANPAPHVTTPRVALAYSDGSYNVMADGWTVEAARSEALDTDARERDPSQFTRVVRVTVTVVEDLGAPMRAAEECPSCGRPPAGTVNQGAGI
ncbi:MAG: hypothetical protein HQL39_15440 [Alphaproteobacteria bacterium]|nr:hypothetical protein [Alphaproteobacteria bacterium]